MSARYSHLLNRAEAGSFLYLDPHSQNFTLSFKNSNCYDAILAGLCTFAWRIQTFIFVGKLSSILFTGKSE